MSAHCQKCFASGTRGKSCMKFLSVPPIPFHLNRPPPISLRGNPRFRCVQFGRPTKRQEKKEGREGEEEERKEKERGGKGRAGLTNNSVKTYRGSQPPRISRSISLFSLLSFLFLLSFLINILWMQSVPDVIRREVFRIIVSPFESV